MKDLQATTDELARAIGQRLNAGKPVPLHTVGFLLITVTPEGPNQQAHCSTNREDATVIRVLKGILAEFESRGKTIHNGKIVIAS